MNEENNVIYIDIYIHCYNKVILEYLSVPSFQILQEKKMNAAKLQWEIIQSSFAMTTWTKYF